MSVEEAIQPGEPKLPPMPMRPPRGSNWVSWTCALLCLSIGVDLTQLFAEIDKVNALIEIAHGRGIEEHFHQAAHLTSLLTWIWLFLFVVTTVLVLRSLGELYVNLHRLRLGGLTFSRDEAKAFYWPGHALYHWVKLYRSIQEIWRASDPSFPRGSSAWKMQPYSWLVRLWWLLFWLRFIRISVSFQPFPAPDSILLTVLQAAAWISASASALGAIAGVLFILILVRIERRQWQRYDREEFGKM
jgi:hypothetical protein